MTGRLQIEDVTPTVLAGRYPAKAVVGEPVPISAVCYREGHDAIGAMVAWQGPDDAAEPEPGTEPDRAPMPEPQRGPTMTRMTCVDPGKDLWSATVVPDRAGLWRFRVVAFSDPYLTWRHAVTKKLEAGQGSGELTNDLAAGAALLERAAAALDDDVRLLEAAVALMDEASPVAQRCLLALDQTQLLWQHPIRELETPGQWLEIWVDRPRALFSAWYELFPRSEGALVDSTGRPLQHATLASAAKRLPDVARMGFDVVYLPPIHPIGEVNRKGRNNAVVARPDDVGSPWAIGSIAGGHDAIHPKLGEAADFREFIAVARSLGIEVAMDLALQCAPDHPWVAEHPQWFTKRADGTIAYAENPPKKYQDIYPLNFDNDPVGLRQEILRVVRHWIGEGIHIFRVDNPHTKPLDFWHWLIAEIKREQPEVLFLAEAFTRPAMMHGLAALGFSQSYTYFTWRTTADELRQYCEELLAAADYMRPNFWPNTPDILPAHLQQGEPAIFKTRAVLAALLSPSWGIYAGYELCEHEARPGSEEYADSEKYQLRPRDWAQAERSGESLAPFLARLNAIRRQNPALHWLRNLRFHPLDNTSMLCWSKRDPGSDNTVLVVVNLDPTSVAWANTSLDMPALGLDWHERMVVRDQLTGQEYGWGQHNPVRLDPSQPAHIFTVHRRGD